MVCSDPNLIQNNGQYLRLLAADGAFVKAPTCAEVLLLAVEDQLHSAHMGSVRGGREVG